MAIHILAMTRLTGNLWYLATALYGGLIVYILFFRWRSQCDLQRVRLNWLLFLPTGLLATLCFSGRWIWTILLWLQWGDDGSCEEYSRYVSAAVALFTSGICSMRLVAGRSDRRYRLVCLGGTAALAAVFGFVSAFEFTSRIYGWTAASAAENYLAKYRYDGNPFIAPDAKQRLVEEDSANADEVQGNVRRFVVYFDDAPVQEVVVAPYGWWWWTFASARPLTPIISLDWAIDNWDRDREEAKRFLEGVARDYPNSDASRWASDTLERLREQGSSGAPRWRPEMLRRLQEQAKGRRE